MIYKCRNCSAPLLFKPQSGMLECDACDAAFWVTQFEDSTEIKDEMQIEYYSCKACAAEIAVNDVEVSTFCAYCGQPTVVFDRVSSIKKPDYIIPFKISKKKAVQLIREYVKKGAFVPKEVKNFEVERVRGIYIPFWLHDVEFFDTQFLSGDVDYGQNTRTEYFKRQAHVTFHDVTIDASKQLNNSVTERLEPYNTKEMVPFHPAYLSGFYADCFDYQAEEMESYLIYRCKNLFDEEIKTTIEASDIRLINCFPYCNVMNKRYAMLPAWFITFRYDNVPYTILVNGQTQKVVGAVPYNKKLVVRRLLAVTAGIMLIVVPIMYFLCWVSIKSGLIIWEYLFTLFMFIIGVIIGGEEIKDLKNSIGRSGASSMNRFVKDRQEG